MTQSPAGLALAAVRHAKQEISAAGLASVAGAHQRLTSIERLLRDALTGSVGVEDKPAWDELRKELKGLQMLLQNAQDACAAALEAAHPPTGSTGQPATKLIYLG